MKFRYLILLNFLLISAFSFTQEITKGDIIKDRQFLIDKSEITASDELGNFVSVRPHRINGTLRNYYVEFFNNLNFSDRIEIETNNDTDILDVFILNESAHIFIKEKVDRTISLRLDIIDLKTKFKSEKILYIIDKEEDSDVYKTLDNNYNISLYHSSDILLSFPVFNKKNNYVYIKLFSNDLEKELEYIINVENAEEFKNVEFLNVTKYDLSIYVLFEITTVSNKTIYKLVENRQGIERSIEIPTNKETYELINSEIEDNQYYISGLYSYQKNGGFDGFTYYRIDLNSFELQTYKQSPFLNERAKKYFNGFFKSDRNIDINNLFVDSNQNLYIIGQFYILQRQYVPIGIVFGAIPVGVAVSYITINPVSISYKVFDDLLIAKINPQGELQWDNLLELRQTEGMSSKSNTRDTSTFSFFTNNQLNIFMNGYINMENDRLIVKQNKRLSVTNFYNIIVNPNGGISPKIIFPNEDSEILFRAESTIKSGNDLHIFGQGNMRKQLLKLRL